MQDVTIKNLRATNVKQIGILLNGIPGHPIQNITLENINLEMIGGGTAANAKVQLAEKESAYPEVNMFGKTMPVYGIYARHVDGVNFDQITLRTVQPDARPAKQLIDISGLKPANFDEN